MVSVDAVEAICRKCLRDGVSKPQIVDLIGKIRAKLGKTAELTRTEVGGGVYELVSAKRLAKRVTRGGLQGISNPDGVGDQVYTKRATTRVRQQKWATGKSDKVLSNNLTSALDQLAGVVQGNAESAPPNSVAIADIVLTNPPESVLQTFMTEQGMQLYLAKMVRWATEKQTGKDDKVKKSTLGAVAQVSVRVTLINDGTATRYCVDVAQGLATVRPPVSVGRDNIVKAELLIGQLAADVENNGQPVVSRALVKLKNAVLTW